MDVYNLINSNAISEYCRKIEYQFNTEELAVLIYRNESMSVDERIKAYNELIQNYPDMEVAKRINCEHYDSVKTMIEEEIKRLTELRELLLKKEDDVIYTYHEYHIYLRKYLTNNEIDDSRRSFEEIKQCIYDEYINKEDSIRPVTKFEIIKKSFKDNYKIAARFKVINKNLVLTHIYMGDWHDIDLNINNIFLNIPNPFKRGDLLQYNDKIFVLESLITESADLKEKMLKENFDSSDMQGHCYVLNDEGHLWIDNVFKYDSWEYCTKELKGIQRILKAVSSVLKGEIGLDLFLDSCNHIKQQKNDRYFRLYSVEGLKLAGLNEEDKR